MIKKAAGLFLMGMLIGCQSTAAPTQSAFERLSSSSVSNVSDLLPDIQNLTPQDQDALEKALAQAHQAAQVQASVSGPVRKVLEKVLPYLKTRYGYMRKPRTLNTQAIPQGAQKFSLKSIDGTVLNGFYLPTTALDHQNKTVILQHGYQFNKWMAFKRYGFLNKNYNILAIDARAHNQQAGESSLGLLEKEDIKMALRWLENRTSPPHLHEVGLLGESMGAVTVIAAAADWSRLPNRSVQIKGVWSDAAYADLHNAIEERIFKKLSQDLKTTPALLKKWGAGIITRTYLNWLEQDTGVTNAEVSAAPRYNLPILLKASPTIKYAQVHSTEDEQTHFNNALILADIAKQVTGESFSFWRAKGKHVETYQQPEYIARTEAFFSSVF